MQTVEPAPREVARPAPGAAADPEMVLIFRLSGEAFALPVGQVHEILDPMPTTPVPNAGSFAPALINVRGTVAPLIDIRQRLRMPADAGSTDSRVIVLELPVSGMPTRLALLADTVDEVVEVDLSTVEAIPELGTRWPEEFVRGVVRHGPSLAFLLDTETLFRPDADRPAHT